MGLPKEPAVFVVDAVKAGHPRDMLARAPKEVADLLDSFVNEPHYQRLERREKILRVVSDIYLRTQRCKNFTWKNFCCGKTFFMFAVLWMLSWCVM